MPNADEGPGIVHSRNMSRALDKDTLQALENSEPSAAFAVISGAFNQAQAEEHTPLLEIEILPKSHILEPNTFLLQDQNALAISKFGLVQAFFEARKMFQCHHSSEEAILSANDLLAATSVMLLMDPEHLTAANARKRLICSELVVARQLELIRRDRFFVDSLLTSRLHRHTKSPTLWSHRRWLIQTARGLGMQPDVLEDLKRIVMIAGERHPKNYYGWCHARWLTGLAPVDRADKIYDLVAATKSWCFRNHTDISGWSFLMSLLMKLGGRATRIVFEETIKLAISLQWRNESPWVFLRTLAASGALMDSGLKLFQESLDSMCRKSASLVDSRVVEQTRSWYETYRWRPGAARISRGSGSSSPARESDISLPVDS